MVNYEIEIKSLVGGKLQAQALVEKMKQSDPALFFAGKHNQLNHYFVKGNLMVLRSKLEPHLMADKQQEFDDLLAHAEDFKEFSVRTRSADGKVIFVIKVAIDDTTSSNGTARQEFESGVYLTLDELDQILVDCGFEYQAKWSREREEYKYKGLSVTVDKNAGYGYLAEFESVIDDAAKADVTKAKIREIIEELGLQELNQARLARMFDYYNKHWQDYYGTDKTFNIE
ncbi:MAG: CYTH domain-containing protein [Candidatus Doudnabacteria bacterium]